MSMLKYAHLRSEIPNMQQNDNDGILPWKLYIITTVESLLTFFLATFCVAMFFTHRGPNWVLPAIFLGALYLFVIFALVKRVIDKFSWAAIMLIIPIAPLIALIMVVCMIPILQHLQ